MPNLEDDKQYSYSSAEAVALLRLIQMSESDIRAGRVLSVEQAREAINRSRRERIEAASIPIASGKKILPPTNKVRRGC
jgi:hypothetical protein